MATELVAAPLYCYSLLLKITLLSFMYRVIILMLYNICINVFWAFQELFQKQTRSL